MNRKTILLTEVSRLALIIASMHKGIDGVGFDLGRYDNV